MEQSRAMAWLMYNKSRQMESLLKKNYSLFECRNILNVSKCLDLTTLTRPGVKLY